MINSKVHYQSLIINTCGGLHFLDQYTCNWSIKFTEPLNLTPFVLCNPNLVFILNVIVFD